MGYACTKVLDEFLALAYHHEHGLPVIVARFFNTVGPRQAGQWGMVLPNFVGRAIANEPIEVFGTGEQLRCFCHVEDTIRAVEGLVGHEDRPVLIHRLIARLNVGGPAMHVVNLAAAEDGVLCVR